MSGEQEDHDRMFASQYVKKRQADMIAKDRALGNALRAIAAAMVDIQDHGAPTNEQIHAINDAAEILDR